MNLSRFCRRAHGRYMRTASRLLCKRPFVMHNGAPYISFTFDDFPRSALYAGGEILEKFDIRATYYTSFGLMGTVAPPGEIFRRGDIDVLLAGGHELGCHTFDHYDSWKTSPRAFEESIIRNGRALAEIAPGMTFRTFSYPLTVPRPEIKLRAGRHFSCCRCGMLSFNAGVTDLNLLEAFFLEKSRDYPGFIKEAVDKNNAANGWLIFATHDISETHSPYGVTPALFEEVVRYARDSGATILPVAEAFDAIRACREG